MFQFNVYLAALGLTASQIVGIGPQNAFVIRQGISRSHVVPIVLICMVCDAVLISCGVLGVGRLVSAIPGFVTVVTWGGAAFILWLGLKSFRSAWQPGALTLQAGVAQTRSDAIRTILMVTLVNPYVWLDTVILIGGVSSVYGRQAAPSFVLGCLTASVAWFSSIGFLAGKLAPLFQKSSSWRVLDSVIGAVMVFTASMLLWQYGGLNAFGQP